MKIFIAVGSRANYSSIKSVIRKCHEDREIELIIACFASAVLEQYGCVANLIKEEGYPVKYILETMLQGDSPSLMAKTTGLSLVELTSAISQEKPDICFTVGDRHETMATAIASSYSNVLLAHTMGGELSGSIDESIRHAITKLSHYHFTACDSALKRVIRMGEDPSHVYNVGCPRLDLVKKIIEKKITPEEKSFLNKIGVGNEINIKKPFVITSFHPVTTEANQEVNLGNIIKICGNKKLQLISLWPNADAGGDFIAKKIRTLREEKFFETPVRFFKNLPVDIYIKLMNQCSALIGNSSSGIREGAFIGTPCINFGSRQANRDRAKNVIDIDKYNDNEFQKALEKHLYHGKYQSSAIYGEGNSAERILEILKGEKPKIQKIFFE